MKAKVETAIWLALRERVESLPMTIAKAWPAEKFDLPYDGPKLLPFLRVGRVSVAPVRVLIKPGKKHTRTGALIVTLVYPLKQDIKVYDQLAGTIAEHFREGTEMRYDGVCVTVENAPHVQDGYEDNAYWAVPVRIPWRCFA